MTVDAGGLGAPRLLPLDYDRRIDPWKLQRMERAAKARGLPLADIEALGRDEAACDAFLEAAAPRPRSSPAPRVGASPGN